MPVTGNEQKGGVVFEILAKFRQNDTKLNITTPF